MKMTDSSTVLLTYIMSLAPPLPTEPTEWSLVKYDDLQGILNLQESVSHWLIWQLQKERYLPYLGSLLKGLQRQGAGKPKPRIRSGLPYQWQRPRHSGHFCCLHRCIIRNQMICTAVGTQTSTLTWDRGVTGSSSTDCYHSSHYKVSNAHLI